MAGIYIHIPFCHAKCAYCDFYSTPRRERASDYVDALLRELEARLHEIEQPITTIYIGGGTPSSLPAADLRRLVARMALFQPEEFTVEVNPDDVSAPLAEMLVGEGVNRVSMGVQSLIDDELRTVGRAHSVREAVDAVTTLRAAGIDNLSLDLIYGLPGQTAGSWLRSLRGILTLQPEHLSAYALSYEPGTRLWAMRMAGKVAEAPQELSEQMYLTLCEETAGAGMEHYEIANFCMPGYHSRHNSSYWDFTPYLGLGVAAHSFDGILRRYNPTDINAYISARPGSYAVADPETDTERYDDYVMTALRTSRGIDLTDLEARYGETAAGHVTRLAGPLLRDGRMQLTAKGFRIAERSWLLADDITVRFLAD